MEKRIYLNLVGITLLLFFTGIANAQSLTVKGKVTSASTNDALPGASVVIKGTSQGTTTNLDGDYTITVPNAASVLVFSFIGEASQEIAVGSQTTINVALADDVTMIEELVVIGYGSQKKEEVTTAITKVKSDDFVQGMVKSAAQLLQGKVAGLGISTASGNPTDPIQLMIRGTSTISASQEPLVVVDGIPGGSLYAIAPEDIESMTVLKDGSAAAIYGTRGTNGVIIISTKKSAGKKGTSVEYNGSVSVDEISNTRDMLTADDYIRLKNDTSVLYGKKTAQTVFTPLDAGTKTDWVKAITRKPTNQVHNLSFSSGDEKSNYVASLTYREQNGTLLNSDRTSYSARISANHSALNDRLRMSLNVNNSTYKDHNIWTYAYETALLMNPTQAIYNTDGTYFQYGSTQRPYNPVSLLNEETDLNNWNQLLTNGRITIEPIKGWNINATGGIQRNDGMHDKWSTFQHPNTTVLGNSGNVWKWANQRFDYTGEVTTDYTRTIGLHNYSIMGGYSNQFFTLSESYMYAYQFASDQFGAWSFAPSSAIKNGLSDMTANREESRLIAFFGRATYNYNQKYLLMATLRKEGSSKFGRNNKWGYFPAASFGWRINKEAFMENFTFIDDLKFRLGYGVTGTIPTDSYRSLLLLQFANNKVAYFNGEWVKGVVPYQNPNPDLKWETKKELNAGLDFGFFRNRITGSIDGYNRLTSDLLNWYTVPVPPNPTNRTFANASKMENRGIEVVLNAILVNESDFKISVSGNMSYNKNTVTSISNDLYSSDAIYAGSTGSPIQQVTHLIVPGEAIGNFWGWKVVGVAANQKKATDNGKWLYAAKTTDGRDTIKYASDCSDGDKVVLGNGIPKIFAGFNTTVYYKGFDVFVNLRGAFKFQVWNQFRSHFETFAGIGSANVPKSIFNKPMGSTTYNNQAAAYNSYYIEDGDFVKLDNISLGYTFKLPKKLAINKLRVYASVMNLHTFTNYTGLDPEVSILGTDPGIEHYDAYPKTTTYTMGVNVTF